MRTASRPDRVLAEDAPRMRERSNAAEPDARRSDHAASPASRRFSTLPGFVAVGALGFFVDGTILSFLVHVLDASPYWARVASFVPAVTATWYCNRRWVFDRTDRPTREYGAYFGVQTVGACINMATYAALIWLYPLLGGWPLVPLAAGSALALFFNYAAAKRWVFSRSSQS